MSRFLDPVPLLLGGLSGAIAGGAASYAIDGRVDWPLVVALLVGTLVTSLAMLIGAGPMRGRAWRQYAIPPGGPGRWQFRGGPMPPGPPPRGGPPQGVPPHVGPAVADRVGRGPFERFDPGAKRVLALAQDEAVRFNHNYIGTEHLLLGLVCDGDSMAARALNELGIELTKVRTAVEFIIGRGETQTAPSEITLSPRSKKVIELAVDEAQRLGHAQVSSAHLLLGLIREGEGIASGVIESLGVGLAQTRQKVLELMSKQEPPAQQSPPPA